MTGIRPLREYRTIAFDCDGVVLNSNAVKTNAFREIAEREHGPEIGARFVAYHEATGGISRWVKFRYLLETLAGRPATEAEIDRLCTEYGVKVRDGLMRCEAADGLEALRAATPDARWMIVSGGAQHELREIFAARNLSSLFNGGIFGSPDTKPDILAREHAAGRRPEPGLMLGDSVADYEAAKGAGLDFVFVSGWSDIDESSPQWNCVGTGFPTVIKLKHILKR